MLENQHSEIFKELKERLERLKDSFALLDAQADAEIVEWRYSKNS